MSLEKNIGQYPLPKRKRPGPQEKDKIWLGDGDILLFPNDTGFHPFTHFQSKVEVLVTSSLSLKRKAFRSFTAPTIRVATGPLPQLPSLSQKLPG
ncbi:MAG: hypothetical protein BTN85_0372 [Candidatus Methanohalarchaeum thermophilum]|uniref:Uncharacterized protein n=1 Tax=Methanohalarchaeum thermophilum TaxID=1903181 RepID=A0A1Q6DU70_METT1|nr:MAG: hypothetical protein BTN85_0372 [Candidatus Methanohalarchaeum thermophilum]